MYNVTRQARLPFLLLCKDLGFPLTSHDNYHCELQPCSLTFSSMTKRIFLTLRGSYSLPSRHPIIPLLVKVLVEAVSPPAMADAAHVQLQAQRLKLCVTAMFQSKLVSVLQQGYAVRMYSRGCIGGIDISGWYVLTQGRQRVLLWAAVLAPALTPPLASGWWCWGPDQSHVVVPAPAQSPDARWLVYLFVCSFCFLIWAVLLPFLTLLIHTQCLYCHLCQPTVRRGGVNAQAGQKTHKYRQLCLLTPWDASSEPQPISLCSSCKVFCLLPLCNPSFYVRSLWLIHLKCHWVALWLV